MKLKLIVSGGQTGADIAGLRAAKTLEIATAGYAPRHFMTETGPFPQLGSVYGLEEMKEGPGDYLARTRMNVMIADATVIFGKRSPGSNKTEWYAEVEFKKPFLWLGRPLDQRQRVLFHKWMLEHDPETLNVAGNRESKNPGIGSEVYDFLVAALRRRG